jgi:hypothetical protein
MGEHCDWPAACAMFWASQSLFMSHPVAGAGEEIADIIFLSGFYQVARRIRAGYQAI